MNAPKHRSIDEAFSDKWIQRTATAIIRDLQRGIDPKEAFPDRRHESPWRLPSWCFDVAQSSIQQDDIDFWEMLCEHPQLIGGAIAAWAGSSAAIHACPPEDIEHLGLLPADVRDFVHRSVLQSQALRTFVFEATKSVLAFVRPQTQRVLFRDCELAVHRASVACMAQFKAELECFAVIELPALVRGCAPLVKIPLTFVRAPISIPDFPTHSQDVERDRVAPLRDIVSRSDLSGPGCTSVMLVDDSWEMRPEHTARLVKQERSFRAARAAGEAPPPESLDDAPLLRSMRLSDLTIAIRVIGAPAFARSASDVAEQAIRGALESVDLGLLADPVQRKLVFASIVSARSSKGQQFAKSVRLDSRRPGLLRSPRIEISDSALAQMRLRDGLARMEMHWSQQVHSVAVGIDESSLKAMLETCVLYPHRSGDCRRSLNPIAKAFREIHRASRLQVAHPADSLVVAMTAIESTLLRKDSRAERKTVILASRIARLFDCDSDAASSHVIDWFKCLYDVRSRIVHGDVVDESEIRQQQSATLFLASACMLRLCTGLRFTGRLGVTATNESCLIALVDFLAKLDDPNSSDTRAEHDSIGRWPVQLFESAE